MATAAWFFFWISFMSRPSLAKRPLTTCDCTKDTIELVSQYSPIPAGLEEAVMPDRKGKNYIVLVAKFGFWFSGKFSC